MRRLLDLELHQVEQIGAAADELCAWPRRGLSGRFGIDDPLVRKRFHLDPPPATSLMAATMLGYAAHRQMLPLIRSRISTSERAIFRDDTSAVAWLANPAGASASIPAAEPICPGWQ